MNRSTRHAASAWALLLAITLSSTGCATLHVYQIGGTEGREGGNQPSTEWQYRTRHRLAWGLIRQDIPVENCQLGNGTRTGIEEVKVELSLGHALVAALTLGFWSPIRIGWRCAKPPVPSGTLK